MIGLDSPVLKPLDTNQTNRSPKSVASSPGKSSRPSSSHSGSLSPLRKSPTRASSPIRRVLQVQRDAPEFTIYAASEEEERQTQLATQKRPQIDMFDDEFPKENMVEGVVVGDETKGKKEGKNESKDSPARKAPSKLRKTPLGEHWPNLRSSNKVSKPVSPKRRTLAPLSASEFPAYISVGNGKDLLLTSNQGLELFTETFTYELPFYATPPRKRRLSIPLPDTRTSISQPLAQRWQHTAFPLFHDE